MTHHGGGIIDVEEGPPSFGSENVDGPTEDSLAGQIVHKKVERIRPDKPQIVPSRKTVTVEMPLTRRTSPSAKTLARA